MIIGFDLDDVLLDFSNTFCAYMNSTYGTQYKKKEMVHFEIEKVWGGTKEEALNKFLDFYGSAEHSTALPLVGATEIIKALAKDNVLHIITSKPESLRPATEKWLTEHFPDMFKEIHFMSHYHGEGKKRTKAEACAEFGIELFVEDNLEHATNVSKLGVPVLLMDAPWNQAEVKAPITRVHSWEEIAEEITRAQSSKGN